MGIGKQATGLNAEAGETSIPRQQTPEANPLQDFRR
jgi:hypothetical protein